MTVPHPASPLALFHFSERAERLRLRETEPRVYGYAWRHPSPSASLILLHGLQSHAQWFAGAAQALLERGFTVYALDRRGSGSSPAPRGEIETYFAWFEEVEDIIRLARREHPEAPAHLIGHCFGANVGLGTLLTQRPEIQSLVMLTPGLYVRPDYTARNRLRILTSAFLRPQTRFPVPLRPELFTREPEVLAWIERDRLGADTLTARCLLQIHRMLNWLRRGTSRLDVPVLVLEAARDRISDNPRNRAVLTRALGGGCHFAPFDAEHLLLTEPCRDQVLDTLVDWVLSLSLGAGHRGREHGCAR
jgi:acylglycerol lipase